MNPDFSQLRDIHLPESVAWWPPAIGWWLLPILITVLVVFVFWWFKRIKAQRWRKVALEELAQIRLLTDKQQQLKAISALLRRVAITCYPREQVASLTGDSWLKFLDSTVSGCAFQQCAQTLVSAPYQKDEVDVAPLFEQGEFWIKSIKPSRRSA